MAILPVCTQCGAPYPRTGVPYRCSCGGVYDYEDFPRYSSTLVDPLQKGLWKYHAMFGMDEPIEPISLGEGNTPLLSTSIGAHLFYLKLENQNPTASYKDRGSAVLASFLFSRGIRKVVEDSSGNAGASLAAYAARAGIAARIFVPESASGPKRRQIEAYGAEVMAIPGPRARSAEAVLQAISDGTAYASHAYMPFGLCGIATIAYEIVEALGGGAGTIIAPVGHGGLLYGIIKGFQAMRRSGAIQHEPFYVGVQAAGCAPIFQAFESHEFTLREPHESDTIAEGVRVRNPVRGGAILREIEGNKGRIFQVNEPKLLRAYEEIAQKGFFVEPTSALPWAVASEQASIFPDPIVMIVTGSGYKSQF